MVNFFSWQILLLLFVCHAQALNFAVSPQIAEEIGKKVWQSECNGTLSGLVSWNKGEEFASLGIGHFIWYPKEKRGPFDETFPALLSFMKEQHVKLPSWLERCQNCPWNSKAEFDASENYKKELRTFLAQEIAVQTQFIIKRFEMSVEEMISGKNREQLMAHIEKLWQTPRGKFALIDYLNFKGKGTSSHESYAGKGWGLKQALEAMPADSTDPLADFVKSATHLLEERVRNAPPERQEERWLAGWKNRLNTY